MPVLWGARPTLTQREVSADSAPWTRKMWRRRWSSVFFCRQIFAASVDSADAPGFRGNPGKSLFHPSGLSFPGFCINRPPSWSPALFRDEPRSSQGLSQQSRLHQRRPMPGHDKNKIRKNRTSLRCAARGGYPPGRAGTPPNLQTPAMPAVCAGSVKSEHCLDCDDVSGRLGR